MPDGTEWIVIENMAARVRVSSDSVLLEDHYLPTWVEVSVNGLVNDAADPETFARIEVNANGVPRLTVLTFSASDPDSAGIRQADLREVQVSSLVEDLVAGFTFSIERDENGDAVHVNVPFSDTDAYTSALRFVGRRRAGRSSRDITPQLLERVAKVYRDNITGHPTKAVQHHFQVSQRMAAEYVSRARKRGLLPPTKRGKKNA